MIELKSQIRPVLNSQYYPLNTNKGQAYTMTPRGFDIKHLMWWIKRTPECIGIGRRIAMDIISKFHFRAIEKQLTGRPKKNYTQDAEDKAMAWAVNESLREKLVSGVLDWVFTGDAYLWHNKVSDEKIKEISDKYCKQLGLEVKQVKLDEDFSGLSTIELIPSTTVEIRHDGMKVQKYVQHVGAEDRDYEKENVLHARFMYLDGSPYGFSPMQANAGVIQSLGWIKDYSKYYFKNGGSPDMMYKLPKEMAGSPNHQGLIQTLEKYKGMDKKHGSMVITGECDTEEINKWNKDMEFRQYAIYLTGNLAFSFNMPADILSSILGVDVKGTAVGSDIEDAGYNRNIEHSQKYWEDLLNSQFFNPFFGVDIVFEREYKQEQIRLSQKRAQTVPFIEFLFRHDYPVTDEFVHDSFSIPREYLKKGDIKREVEIEGPGGPGISPLSGNPKGPNQQAASNQKKKQQQPQANNSSNIGS